MKRFLGVVALAAMLAISGCAGHHGAGGQTASHPGATSNGGVATGTQAGAPKTTTGTDTSKPAAGATTTAAPAPAPGTQTLTSVDQTLTSINAALTSIDSNISAADKAADNDN